MTCVFAIRDSIKNEILMAGDFQVSTDATGEKWRTKIKKIWKTKSGMIFGFCGTVRMGQIVQYNFKVPKIPKKKDLMEYFVERFIPELRNSFLVQDYVGTDDETTGEMMPGDILVVVDNRIFLISSEFSVLEIADNFCAIGGGKDLANGAFSILENFDMPIVNKLPLIFKAVSHWNNGVTEEFNYLKATS